MVAVGGQEGAGSRLRADGPPEQLGCSVRWKGGVMVGQSSLHTFWGLAQEFRELGGEGGVNPHSLRSWAFLPTVPPGTQPPTGRWTQALLPGWEKGLQVPGASWQQLAPSWSQNKLPGGS